MGHWWMKAERESFKGSSCDKANMLSSCEWVALLLVYLMMQWLLKTKEMNSMNDRCSSIARHATFKAVLRHSRILFWFRGEFATSSDHWPAPQRLKQFAAFGPLTESLAWHPDRWLGLKDPELGGALWWEQGWISCIVGAGISQLNEWETGPGVFVQ